MPRRKLTNRDKVRNLAKTLEETLPICSIKIRTVSQTWDISSIPVLNKAIEILRDIKLTDNNKKTIQDGLKLLISVLKELEYELD